MDLETPEERKSGCRSYSGIKSNGVFCRTVKGRVFLPGVGIPDRKCQDPQDRGRPTDGRRGDRGGVYEGGRLTWTKTEPHVNHVEVHRDT